MTTTFESTDVVRVGHTVDYWAGLLASIPEDAAMTVIVPGLKSMSVLELQTAVLLLVKASAASRTALREAIPALLDLGKEAGVSAEDLAVLETTMRGLL